MRTRDGTAVAGAIVVCRPRCFHPLTRAQYAALSSETNVDGFFSLSQFPLSDLYDFFAYTREQFVETRMTGAQVRSGPVQLTIQDLCYEKFEFVDTAGNPVSVRDYKLKLIHGQLLASTDMYEPSWFRQKLWADMGLEVYGKPNEVVTVYRNQDTYVFAGEPSPKVSRQGGRLKGILYPARTITIPGYEPALVQPYRRPMSDWPRSQRVELTPDDARANALVRHRVVFPQFAWPEAWIERDARYDIQLRVVMGEPPTASFLRRVKNVFRAPRGTKFRLKFDRHLELDYELEDRNHEIVVTPRFPELGFVDVVDHFQSAAKPRTLFLQSEADPRLTVRGQDVWPGYARFRPLPVGKYRLLRHGFSSVALGGPRGPGEFIRTITVVPGFRSYEIN